MAPDAPSLVPIGTVARELGVSVSQVRLLTSAGLFSAVRTSGGHRRYDLAEVRRAWAQRDPRSTRRPETFDDPSAPLVVDRADPLDGLEESAVWRDIQEDLDLGGHSPARAVCHYTFTEMLNNAIDHSGGTASRVRVWADDDRVTMMISDDGIGIYRHLLEEKDLPDLFAAVSELTKGKQTTAPREHSGEGIFFTSKAVDVFVLEANGIAWTVDNVRGDHAVGMSDVRRGTVVRLSVDRHTSLDLGDLFREFTQDGEFTRTRPVIKLFAIGVDFVSRSEAKRLLAGMEKFTEIDLDFAGVNSVGQGFVDELFRVWPSTHPETTLNPINMNAAVTFMVTRGLPPRSG